VAQHRGVGESGTKSPRGNDASHREEGVAELRSSVIRVNSKIASTARRRKKEGEKEMKSY
jgi:hypothetical protein